MMRCIYGVLNLCCAESLVCCIFVVLQLWCYVTFVTYMFIAIFLLCTASLVLSICTSLVAHYLADIYLVSGFLVVRLE